MFYKFHLIIHQLYDSVFFLLRSNPEDQIHKLLLAVDTYSKKFKSCDCVFLVGATLDDLDDLLDHVLVDLVENGGEVVVLWGFDCHEVGEFLVFVVGVLLPEGYYFCETAERKAGDVLDLF